jgi:hypothetical protein
MVNKVLAVQNCGPSGTTLLQSLLDGHPQILSLPGLHGQQLLVHWGYYAGSNRIYNKTDIYTQFMRDFSYFYDPGKMNNGLGLMDMGIRHDEKACVDKNLFEQYLQAEWEGLDNISRKQFIVSVYRAYSKALGRSINEEGYLLYPIHSLNKKYALWLIEDFSEVRFLHIIREPVQSIGSLAKHINKNPDWNKYYLLSCVTAQMLGDYTIHAGDWNAHGMRPYVQDSDNGLIQSRAVRLEDIHRDTKTTLSKVCDWLNISWNDILLQSTFDSKLWHNRPESIRQSGVGSKTISQQHEDLLSPFDRLRLDYLARPFNHYYGYKNNPVKKYFSYLMPFLILFPFKMEFLSNRRRQGNFTEYLKCRTKWLLPAWVNTWMNKKQDFVKLL